MRLVGYLEIAWYQMKIEYGFKIQSMKYYKEILKYI